MMANLSKSESTMLNLQYQMKQNNHELQNFLEDLDSWENEMKELDTKLKDNKPSEETKLPPVRNSLEKKKKKKVKKKPGEEKEKPKRIKGYDYRSWDKFDVDKACENIDDDNRSSSEYDYETDEEWENERKKQAAVMEKDTGNEYFKKGDYDNAIECYTKGYNLDPTNPLLPANRAMALLKQEKYAAAELDCSVALTLDPLYTKAYLRRGAARMGMTKFEEAKCDFERVLQLEPQNKKAKSDLEKIEKELAKNSMVSHADPELHVNKDAGVVKPVYKTRHERSKKPLRRIHIEEVGIDEDANRKVAIASTLSQQSMAKKEIMEKEQNMFEKFTAQSPAQIGAAADMDNITNSISQSSAVDIVCDSARIQIEKLDLSDGGGTDNKTNTSSEDNKTETQNKSSGSKQKSKPSTNHRISPSTSPRELSVPTTSIQFQTDYKLLKDHSEKFYQYFKKIPSSDFPKLFGQFLDADVLLKILNIIKDFYLVHGDECLQTLQMLTKVKRFSMVVMFFSKKEKAVLQDIFTRLKTNGGHIEETIKQLEKAYSL